MELEGGLEEAEKRADRHAIFPVWILPLVDLFHGRPRYHLLAPSIKRPRSCFHANPTGYPSAAHRLRLPRRLRRAHLLIQYFLATLLLIIVTTPFLWPSYTVLPPHYQALKTKCLQSTADGRANPSGEQIFIAISLYDKDGHLASGGWGRSVLALIELLGNENVFLSIYQSDSGNTGALEAFKEKVKCRHYIVNDLLASKEKFPKITLPTGSQFVKRIVYLAEMRNRALRPLDQAGPVKYDKVLFLNDIYFDPVDAVQLLFSTNAGANEDTQYEAVCALDYSNPFKFYDLFVMRDAEGYSMGVPFYPIFANAGRGESRSDMLRQADAVRVKSCWSGMVAVQAKYLQASTQDVPRGFQDIGAHVVDPEHPVKASVPVRFRAEPEIYLDASECCLFIADILQVSKQTGDEDKIFVNPYVRVAYDPKTLSWLSITRRFERLFNWPHRLASTLARLPTFNPYRGVEEDEVFEEEVWQQDLSLPGNGTWQLKPRRGRNGLYCAVRETQVLQKSPRTQDGDWFKVNIPPGQKLYFPV